jgi:hypothetical protein
MALLEGRMLLQKSWSRNVGLLGKAFGAYSMYGSYNTREKEKLVTNFSEEIWCQVWQAFSEGYMEHYGQLDGN